MGKFFEALKKSEKARLQPAAKPIQEKVVKIQDEEINGLRLETTAVEQEPTARSFLSSGKIHPMLISMLDPQSHIAEKFKLLRTKILCGNRACHSRTIMVTSPQPFDGKSTVTTNLAVSIAQGINEHVLLADCDLREPSVHRLFGLEASKGIREYLEEGASVEPYLLRTQLKKLTILPAGQPPPNPSELLSSEKMCKLIEELKDRYQDRYIILDTAPAGFAAETNFLSTMVDGVLLVVRYGKTSMHSVMEAVEDIGREKILGIVFNSDNEARKKYSSYYYRYYQVDRRKKRRTR